MDRNERGGVIYLVTSSRTDGVYVGCTVTSLRKRWNFHVWCAKTNKDNRSRSYPLQRAIRKYGQNAFEISVLEEIETHAGLLEAERWWIRYLRGLGAKLYNATDGGEGSLGRRQTEAAKEKMRGPRRLSQQQILEAAQRYSDGESTVAIGRSLGVSHRTISTHISRAGVTVSSKSLLLDHAGQADICRRYLAGESAASIASDMGTSPRPILSILRSNEVEIRGARKILRSQLPDLIAEIESGKTVTDAALKFGVTPGAIKYLMKRGLVPLGAIDGHA